MSTERRVRRICAKAGYTLHKSRVNTPNPDNLGGYMIVDLNNVIVAGSRYELALSDVLDFLGV